MKKSLLASLLILTTVDSFASFTVDYANPISAGWSNIYCPPNRDEVSADGYFYYHIFQQEGSQCLRYTWATIPVSSCPVGQTPNSVGLCSVPPPPSLSDYNGNRQGCHDNGGWYIDSTCGTKDQFYTKIKTLTASHIAGVGLTFGGAVLTAGGLIAGAALAPAVGAAVLTTGLYSMIGGAVWTTLTTPDAISDNGGSATTNSISKDGKTIKISLANYTPSTSSPTTATSENATGKIITQVDETTNKVTSALYVPNSVIDQLDDPSRIDIPSQTITNPVDLTGVQKYEFSPDGIVWKTSYDAPNTPPTVTQSTYTPIQNPNGSVTNDPLPSSGVPKLSSDNGGSIVSPPNTINNYNGASSDTIASDQAALLSGIKANTASTAASTSQTAQNTAQTNSLLDDIKGMFTNDTAVDTTLSDGSDTFGSLGDTAKGSFSGFVYTDPLGINALGGSYTVPTYSFNLLGHNFVLFNEAMLNNLPLSLIQNLFMFIAAILAFVTVISGV